MEGAEPHKFRVDGAALPDKIVDGYHLSRPGSGGANQIFSHSDSPSAFQQGLRGTGVLHGDAVKGTDGAHRFFCNLSREDMGVGVGNYQLLYLCHRRSSP